MDGANTTIYTIQKTVIPLCDVIFYSRGAITESFTDKFENAQDAFFSHAYRRRILDELVQPLTQH